ncbi:MAG: hypothetical protein LBU32_19750 [Clostridiales bacterium]|jgi:hypothetical protein|nr:hypothetical protein [Clostridiales bacterium]
MAIRMVILKMDEEQRYNVIKELVDHGGGRHRAALALDCSERAIDRCIAGCKLAGEDFFIHGSRGRQPIHALAENARSDIPALYAKKYSDANFAHFTGLLEKEGRICASESAVRKILSESDVLSPKAN